MLKYKEIFGHICNIKQLRIFFQYAWDSKKLYLQTDGSVVAWDLREPSSMHRSHYYKDQDFCFRYPTYNTGMKNMSIG